MDNAGTMAGAYQSDASDGGLALGHAQALLRRLGIAGDPRPSDEHPALGWRRSGLMAVTGWEDGPGLVCPVPVTSAANGTLAALAALAPDAVLPPGGAALLGERARLLGLSRHGTSSANQSCRLLATRDGHVALNLARVDDWDLIAALFEDEASDWAGVTRLAANCMNAPLVARGRLLGMAIAESRAMPPPPAPFLIERAAAPRPARVAVPLVADFSSLWAGPLAASLIGMAGANVVKIESSRRPDGARFGHAGFFDLLNAAKEQVSFDFSNAGDLARLKQLVDQADIVIEGSRPRALEQLGLRAHDVAARGGTWVSITAHGRTGEAAGHVGFGDDAAIAGGLGEAMLASWGAAMFAGDAIADPLAGITAALAGWAGWRTGGGCVIALSLADVIAHACALPGADAPAVRQWQSLAESDTAPFHAMRTAPTP